MSIFDAQRAESTALDIQSKRLDMAQRLAGISPEGVTPAQTYGRSPADVLGVNQQAAQNKPVTNGLSGWLNTVKSFFGAQTPPQSPAQQGAQQGATTPVDKSAASQDKASFSQLENNSRKQTALGLQRSLRKAMEVYGPAHPETLKSLKAVSDFYKQQMDMDKTKMDMQVTQGKELSGMAQAAMESGSEEGLNNFRMAYMQAKGVDPFEGVTDIKSALKFYANEGVDSDKQQNIAINQKKLAESEWWHRESLRQRYHRDALMERGQNMRRENAFHKDQLDQINKAESESMTASKRVFDMLAELDPKNYQYDKKGNPIYPDVDKGGANLRQYTEAIATTAYNMRMNDLYNWDGDPAKLKPERDYIAQAIAAVPQDVSPLNFSREDKRRIGKEDTVVASPKDVVGVKHGDVLQLPVDVNNPGMLSKVRIGDKDEPAKLEVGKDGKLQYGLPTMTRETLQQQMKLMQEAKAKPLTEEENQELVSRAVAMQQRQEFLKNMQRRHNELFGEHAGNLFAGISESELNSAIPNIARKLGMSVAYPAVPKLKGRLKDNPYLVPPSLRDPDEKGFMQSMGDMWKLTKEQGLLSPEAMHTYGLLAGSVVTPENIAGFGAGKLIGSVAGGPLAGAGLGAAMDTAINVGASALSKDVAGQEYHGGELTRDVLMSAPGAFGGFRAGAQAAAKRIGAQAAGEIQNAAAKDAAELDKALSARGVEEGFATATGEGPLPEHAAEIAYQKMRSGVMQAGDKGVIYFDSLPEHAQQQLLQDGDVAMHLFKQQALYDARRAATEARNVAQPEIELPQRFKRDVPRIEAPEPVAPTSRMERMGKRIEARRKVSQAQLERDVASSSLAPFKNPSTGTVWSFSRKEGVEAMIRKQGLLKSHTPAKLGDKWIAIPKSKVPGVTSVDAPFMAQFLG